MKLHHLSYFVAVAQHGSFSKAARTIRVAQPALSLHISHLESELGVQLFVRHSKGVQLTSDGEQLIRHAHEINTRVAQISDLFRTGADNPAGVVRLGIPLTTSPVLATPLLQAVQDRYPDVSLHLVEVLSGYLVDMLVSGRIDLAVLYNETDIGKFNTRSLSQEDLYLVGGPQAKLPPGGEIGFRDLKKYPLTLTTPAHGIRQLVNRIALDLDISLRVDLEIDSAPHILERVSRGLGFTIAPQSILKSDWKNSIVSMRRIVDPNLRLRTVIAAPRDRRMTTAAKCVMETTTEIAAKLLKQRSWPGAHASWAS